MKLKLIIAFLFILQQTVSAQNLLIFSGRIYDNSTKEPLPYASISIPHTGTGVISNEYGEFIYHIPENSGNGLIRISFIGYETIFVDTDTVQQDIVYDFQIQPQTVEIGEIDIVAKKLISPEKIVKQAIRNIKKNYPGESFQLHGYYRDYIRNLNSNDYNNLTESCCDY